MFEPGRVWSPPYVRAERGSVMMRRAIIAAVVVGLLVSGLLGTALADNRTYWVGPGPKPWQCGDPDWPAFSKVRDVNPYLVGVRAGSLAIQPVGPASMGIQPERAGSVLEERRSLSRRYEVRILGYTIRIRR
jgi:hypothetical protein